MIPGGFNFNNIVFGFMNTIKFLSIALIDEGLQ